MKTAFIALSALASISSVYADTRVSLTVKNGVQYLSMEGRSRPGVPLPGVIPELPRVMMQATRVLKVSRHPDASLFEGNYVSGGTSCPIAFCQIELRIEQKAGRGNSISKIAKGLYEVRGDAAREIMDAARDAGVKPRKSSSKTPSTIVEGDSYICSANPLGGMKYKCALSVDENLK